MKNNFPSPDLLGGATDAFVITPSDSADLPQVPRAIYVGGAGDVVVTFPSGNYTFKAVPVGTTLLVRPSRVRAASTATLMLGLL